MNKLEKTVFDKTLERLKNDPENWKFDEYHATYTPTGLKVWIANGMTFYEISYRSPEVFNNISYHIDKTVVGGMNIFPIFIPWRVKLAFALWKAYHHNSDTIKRKKQEQEDNEITEFLNQFEGDR